MAGSLDEKPGIEILSVKHFEQLRVIFGKNDQETVNFDEYNDNRFLYIKNFLMK